MPETCFPRQLSHVIETEVNRTATAFLAMSVACELDEDPSHHLRRQSQNVRAILKLDADYVGGDAVLLRDPPTRNLITQF